MSKKAKRNFISLLVIAVIALFWTASEKVGVNLSGNDFAGNGDAVYVHFIDVGQGSSTLFQQGDKGILIDTGESDYGESLVSYIQSCGVKELEYVVASHPHSDHIGAMTDVLEAFPVGEVVMPELSEINTPTSRIYEKFLDAVDEENCDVVFVDSTGYSFSMGNISLETLGPIEQVKELNNMSVVCRASVYASSFLLLGDAEKQEMNSILKYADAYSLKSDVVTMGHHGSRESVNEKFLSLVGADTAIISCGKDNSYGHPHSEALDYIEDHGMRLYRTDRDGTVVFQCNGSGYERIKD
ncbi:MAG: ComEC/Rec2 family competence protein [Acutalibacteraceae bacterium]